MRMRVDVLPTGRNTATIVLTQEQVDAIRGSSGRGRVPLAIAFDDRLFRTSISVYRGEWMMVVNKEMRDAGLVPGHSFDVDISLDAAERTVDVPDDLAAALERAGVRPAFDALSFTRRKEQVRTIEEAKRPDTRQRRIDAAVSELGGR